MRVAIFDKGQNIREGQPCNAQGGVALLLSVKDTIGILILMTPSDAWPLSGDPDAISICHFKNVESFIKNMY